MSVNKALQADRDYWKNLCAKLSEENSDLVMKVQDLTDELVFVESLTKNQLVNLTGSVEGNPNLKEMLCSAADTKC